MKKKATKKKTSAAQAADAGDDDAEDDYPESFEAGLGQAQQIVRQLESGTLSLEESLAAYELGVRRVRQCQEFLSDFQRRIQLLTGFDAQGKPVTEAFDEQQMTLDEKQQARSRRRGAGKPSARKPSADKSNDDDDDDLSLF